MKKLTLKQWLVALVLLFFITVSLLKLALAYFVTLSVVSSFRLDKEDQWAVEQFHLLFTNAFVMALTSGLILGICLPIAFRWVRRGTRGLAGASDAEPGTAPTGGPATPLGNPGGSEGPPSVG